MSSRSLNTTMDDPRLRGMYIECSQKLGKVLDVLQSEDFNVHGKAQDKLRSRLLDQVQKIYEECGLKIFCETLFRIMVVPFQCKDNPFVTKVIEFFFAIILDERWGEPSNELNDTASTTNGSLIEDGSTEPLPVRILRLCEKYHTEARAMVRQRIMLTVAKIIPERISIEDIRRTLQMKLIKMLLLRIKDKSDQVRVLSVRNLCQFVGYEVPFSKQILTVLIDSMRYDPEHSVRAKIVSSIKITDESLEFVVERTGDPNPIVRTAAINRVTESIPLKNLSIEMREAILKANITEDTPKNVEKAMGAMLESWLTCLKNDPCEFLRVLNVRKREKLCYTALNSLYNQSSHEVAFEKMSTPVLNDKRYPDESLCIESTYLWLYMYKRFKNEPYIYNKLSLPVNEMLDYIVEYIELVEEEGDLPLGDLEYRSWMLGDLLQILSFLPEEEGGRKAILEFLPALCLKKRLMDQRNSSLVVKLISVSSNVLDENIVIDLVNCILDSDRPSIRKSTAISPANLNQGSSPVPVISDKVVDPEISPTSFKLELGNLMHRRKKLERDQEMAMSNNDMYKAQACQDEINLLESQIRKVKENIEAQALNTSANNTLNDTRDNEEEEEEQWTYSDRTMLIVLSLVKTNILCTDKISNFWRTFFEMYTVNAVSRSKDPAVRRLALELMCIFGLEYEEECSRAAVYCLMALLKDTLDVKITALKCLYDLVLRYSFARLGGYPEVQGVLMGTKSITDLSGVQVNTEDPASTLKSLLLSYIRNDEVRLVKVGVAGVLKLLFRKEMSNSRVITTFLINWAIPSQESHIRFKDVGTVIPVYANVGENETVEVAQSLLNCIKRIFVKMHSRAQGDEITPHADISKIVNLIVKSTDPCRLTEFQRCYIGHEAIANGALQELRKVDLLTDEKMQYAKLLKILDLSQCPSESINQMIYMLSEIAETSNRTIGQILGGFSSYLETLIVDRGESLAMRNDAAVGAFDNDSSNEEINTD